MIKKIGPWLLVLVLPACASVKPDAQGFRADGYGRNCTEALQQAKVKATEDYKGTFLSSRRSLNNANEYAESIDEYSGGIVQSYKVLSNSGGSPCTVSIEAKVSPDAKSIVVNSEKNIDLGIVERHLNKQISTRGLLRKLVRRPEMIQVESRTIDPIVKADGSVEMAVQFTKIVPSPKWLTDIESFLKVHGTKHSYHEKNKWAELGKGFLVLAALPVLIPVAIVVAPFIENKSNITAPPNPGDSFSLCFAGNDEVNCYQGWAADEVYEQINSAAIVAIMNRDGTTVAGFPVRDGVVTLNQHVDTKTPWVDDQNRPKSKFDLVAEKAINVQGNLNFASNWVTEGYDLKFRLKFN